MTTNKPEVVAIKDSDVGGLIELKPVLQLPHNTRLIRLSDYEALQAECEKLRNLLRHAQPIIRAHAGASHMLDGFRPKRNQWDEIVEDIDAAIAEGEGARGGGSNARA